ncbi:MAG: TetR/AcrR family transcriptional regulator, partial [Deltaproteobacteria bacterium]|nr:TetR/AcrR family transcriptional regulator [Deltaproteobacteria bacterium]
TQERILAATETLLAERDFGAVSVTQIAKAAKSSVGAFYARFRDKSSLLHMVHERFCEEAQATLEDAMDPARWEGSPLTQVVEALVAFMVHTYQDRSGLMRTFLIHGVSHPAFQEREQRLAKQMFANLDELMRSRYGEIAHPNPAKAASFGLQMLLGTVQSLYVVGRTGREAFHKDARALTEELTRAYLAYLGVELKKEGRPEKGEQP